MMVKFGALPEGRTAFFLCDIQEKFRPAMLHFDEVVAVAEKLVQFSRIAEVPLIVTEQNPKGLGKTVSELDIKHAAGIYPKTKFSMVVPSVISHLSTLCNGHLECVVLFGIETHVCVEQTAAELMARGIQVHVVADASTSRSQEDRLLALQPFKIYSVIKDLETNIPKTNVLAIECLTQQRMRQIGCFITTFEAVIFKLLGDKEHPKFKDVRPLIKTTSPNTGLAGLSKI